MAASFDPSAVGSGPRLRMMMAVSWGLPCNAVSYCPLQSRRLQRSFYSSIWLPASAFVIVARALSTSVGAHVRCNYRGSYGLWLHSMLNNGQIVSAHLC